MPESVKLNLRPLRLIRRDLRSVLRATGTGAFVDLMNQWSRRYLGFARRRYVRFSRGGGDWPPLAPATVRKRRKGKTGKLGVDAKRTGGRVAILRDTGTLLHTLDVDRQDNRRGIRGGVEVGFLPTKPAKQRQGGGILPVSGLTIAELASYHQHGKGHLPQRKVIVEPDDRTVELMAHDASDKMTRLIAKRGMR